MNIVLDTNILFSLMNPRSTASYLFDSLDVDFIAPSFIVEEFEKHKDECMLKSGLSEEQFSFRCTEVFNRIRLLGTEKYDMVLKQAKEKLSDEDDAPYLALALSVKSPIWSNDPHLKEQSAVPVYSTSEVIDKLLSGIL